MNRNFSFLAFRPYGWAAFAIWVFGILGPEALEMPEAIGVGIFVAGFLVFLFGGFKGLISNGKQGSD